MHKIYFLLLLALVACSKGNKSSPEAIKDPATGKSPDVSQVETATWSLSSIEVGDLDFGLVESNTQRILTVDIINDSEEVIQGTVSLSQGAFSILSSNCSKLIPQQKCYVKVGFDSRGKEESTYTANLSYAGFINVITAQIDSSGETLESAFYSSGIRVASYNFGLINYNHNLIKSIAIKNTGSQTQNEQVTLSGSAAFIKIYDNCSGRDLPAQKRCLVKVYLSGQGQNGVVNGQLSYGDKSLSFNGEVKTQEQLAQENSEFIFIYDNADITNTPIDLQTLNLKESKEYKFYVKNIGTSEGFINSFALASEFNVFYNNCSGKLIYPNQSCHLRAYLVPQTKGTFSTNLTADVDYQVNSQSIQWTVRSPGDKIACTNEIPQAQLANITWDGALYSQCQVEQCVPTHHVFDNECIVNVIDCEVSHGSGTQTWSESEQEYQSCVVDECESNRYEIVNNSCSYIQPVAQNLNFTLNEDTVLSNQDFSFTTGIGSGTIELMSNVSHGQVVLNGNKFTYTPSADYNGSDSFTYRVYDGQVNSQVATVSLTISPVNDAPVAVNLAGVTSEDTALNLTLLGATDRDQGTVLTYSVVNGPSQGVLTGSGANLTYLPNANVTGSDSFTFKASDGSLDSNVVTYSITITPVNDVPVANPQTVAVVEDTPKAITLTGSDVEGSNLTYILVSGPSHGALSGTIPNYTYTPSTHYNGTDSFVFKVSDGQLQSAEVTVSINISPVNDIPAANPQTMAAMEYNTSSGTLTASDVDLDTLSYSIASQGTKGVATITNAATGEFTYTPNAGVGGTDTFTIMANDGQLDSLPVAVTVNIKSVDHSCDAIKARGLPSGQYGIDFDDYYSGEAVNSVYCEFDIDAGNAWTQVARVNQNDTLWNAWSSDYNLSRTSDTESFGLKMQRFTENARGRDLEVMFKVNGTYRNVVYYDVNLNNSFNPSFSSGTNVTSQVGMFYRSFGESSYTRCENTFVSSNHQWNWAVSDTANSSCGGYGSKNGFILAGSSTATETAATLYGLNAYNASTFNNIEVFVRKRTLAFPISCQHGLDNGLVSGTGFNSIDVDSNGSSQTIHCEVSGSTAYTLLVNFGNNTRYSNRGVLRNGVVTNSESNVESAGFTTNANSWNSKGSDGDYATSNNYLQFFLGGTGTGYIRIRGPKWGGYVWSRYSAVHGAGNYARMRISGSTRDNDYGIIEGNSTTSATAAYDYKNSDLLWWEENPSSIMGMQYIFIK